MSPTYVQHNTMLEGYCVLNSVGKSNDLLTSRSKYYLDENQIRRLPYILNTTVSYTTRFATIFGISEPKYSCHFFKSTRAVPEHF